MAKPARLLCTVANGMTQLPPEKREREREKENVMAKPARLLCKNKETAVHVANSMTQLPPAAAYVSIRQHTSASPTA